jgi:hypothetical protein
MTELDNDPKREKREDTFMVIFFICVFVTIIAVILLYAFGVIG